MTLNTGDGILMDACGGAPYDNLIEFTSITANGRNGILILDGSGNRVTGATITGNNTAGSGYGGVAVFGGCTSVHQSTISGNQCYGVYADESLSQSPVDATDNDWGDPSGPSGAGFGIGDPVSEYVIFAPWIGLDPLGDLDNDGWPNQAEAQAGTDSDDADDYPLLTIFSVGGSGANDANLGDPTHPFATLHGAFERLNGIANELYTVNLTPGTYSKDNGETDEPLILNQDVLINGVGAVLDGSGASNWKTGFDGHAGCVEPDTNRCRDRTFRDRPGDLHGWRVCKP